MTASAYALTSDKPESSYYFFHRFGVTTCITSPTNRNVFIRWFLLSTVSLSLSACSVSPVPQPKVSSAEFDRITTVDLEPGTTQAELEALYGGDTVLFDADEGFAVLGFRSADTDLSTLSLSTSSNQDTFGTPQLSALGARTWAGGARTWAGGARTWAGGARTWAGGARTWAGGVQTGTPLDNYEAWEQIGALRGAHEART